MPSTNNSASPPSSKHPDTPDPRPSPSVTTTRPDQGEFTKEQKAWLLSRLDEYKVYVGSLAGTGIRLVKGVKGDKSEWVVKNIVPDYITHFNANGPEGPNLDSLKKVCDTIIYLECI